MAPMLSVFSATLGSSKTVYEHKQLSGKEKSSRWSLISLSDSPTKKSALFSVRKELTDFRLLSSGGLRSITVSVGLRRKLRS